MGYLIKKFDRKPSSVSALIYDGTKEMAEFLEENYSSVWAQYYSSGRVELHGFSSEQDIEDGRSYVINPGDYLIIDSQNSILFCEKDLFEQFYIV